MAIKNVNTERLLQEALGEVQSLKKRLGALFIKFIESHPQFSAKTAQDCIQEIDKLWVDQFGNTVPPNTDDELGGFVFSCLYDDSGEGREHGYANPQGDDIDVALAKFVTYVGKNALPNEPFWKTYHYDVDHPDEGETYHLRDPNDV